MPSFFPQRMGRLISVLAIIVFIGLQYLFWFGEGGFFEHRKLKKQIAEENKNNLVLVERNRILRAEVGDLKHGLEAIEEHARLDLGLIKPNETFVQLSVLPPPVQDEYHVPKTVAGIGHLNEAEVPDTAE